MTVRQTRVPVLQEQTEDRQANKLQDNASQGTKALNRMPFSNGVLLDREQDAYGKPFGPLGAGLSFTAGTLRTLSHGLQRVPQGFFVVDATFAEAGFIRGNPTVTSIDIRANANCVVKLWVW